MISRDPVGLAGESFDLIVIGGGIYGCTLVLECARRGLRPLLVERDDFGQHTSSNSFRILHGGLRYLQTLNLRRFFESVYERAWFLRAFPDHARPFPFVMPLYGDGLRRPSIMGVALRANDLLSRGRNRGVRPDRSIPEGRVLSRDEVKARLPDVPARGLLGGGLWYDAVMSRPQRIVMEILRWAVSRGASVLNYTGAEKLLTEGRSTLGVRARDALTGRLLDYRSPVVVNCCGPWVRDFARRADRDLLRMFRPSLAMNLLLDRKPDFDVGVAVSDRETGNRTYFLYPWEGRIFAGTYHVPSRGAGGEEGPSEAQVEGFVRELRAAAPFLDLSMERVLHVQWGRLPVVREGTVQLTAREIIHDHGRNAGPEGLFSVSGVKFTVARRVAQRVLDRLTRRGLTPEGAPPSDDPPRPSVVPTLREVQSLLDADAERATGFIAGLAKGESVVRREDLLLRRTDWGSPSHPGVALTSAVEQVVSVISEERENRAGLEEGLQGEEKSRAPSRHPTRGVGE